MLNALKWVGMVLGVLLLAAATLFTIARLAGPTSAQRAAVELMQQSQEFEGRNAFAALWLVPYDVPPAELEAVTQEDVRRYQRLQVPPGNPETPVPVEAFKSVAAGRFSGLPEQDPQAPPYCQWREQGCLQRVRADMTGYAAVLERDAPLLSRVAALSDYQYSRNLFTDGGLDAPIPPLQLLSRPLTQHAHQFLQGNVDQALAGTCRDAATARMLMRSGDNLITSMVSVAMLQGNLALFAQMLAGLPADHPLPAGCGQVFALPVEKELSLCNALRSEYRTVSGLMASSLRAERQRSDWSAPVSWAYNLDKTNAQAAERFARWCGEPAASMLRDDVPARLPPLVYRPWSLQCLDNAAGCIVNNMAAPAYADYQVRMQDSGAQLRLLRAVLWLRGNADPSRPMAEQLATLPAEYRQEARNLRLSEGGRSLVIDMFDSSRGATWQLPLPESMTRTNP